jgi:integral membrane protein
MLRVFRIIALVEGITTLALFGIAMPLKYGLGIPDLIRPIGLAHGIAWLTYLAAMVVCLPGKGFTPWHWLRTFVASLFPFGTFLNDGLIKHQEEARRTQMA